MINTKRHITITQITLIVGILFCLTNCKSNISHDVDIPHFEWIDTVGAQAFPKTDRIFYVENNGAVGDAVTLCTEAIQKTIDEAEQAGGGIVTFAPGMYLTGSIFVGNNVNLLIPRGTTILGSTNINDYKEIATRIAGVEMNWPAAVINVIGKTNAAITGQGVIDGRGRLFWEKYYEMRNDYETKGLRWVVDYDCPRPRGVLISDCHDITVKDVVIYRPGFWSLHILYSNGVTIDGIIISNNIERRGPSTDGIDIDSSSSILVQNCNINCNDDNFCLKAGRDADGIRVNRPCEYVVIRDCVAGYGGGLITCGSETSGGINNIVAYNLKAIGTQCGLRFKSTCKRGGIIENIYMSNIQMDKVVLPISVDLNWHPTYSNSLLPEGYEYDTLPIHWKKLLEDVSLEKGTPKFRNLFFSNIKAKNAYVCIDAIGIEQSTLDNFSFKNVSLQGEKGGKIAFDKDWNKLGLSIDTIK